MLTTLHYYDYYKPYILNKDNKKSQKSTPSNNTKQDSQYFMNKALTDNVKSYIFEMSSNFNGLKNISNNLTEKFETKFMSENLKEELEGNIETFTHTYNRFIGFLDENAENSKDFKNMSSNIKRFSYNNRKILDKMGIQMDSEGFLFVKENSNLKNIQKNKETLKQFYSKVYNNLCKFMKEPMSKHMEFKDFSFYFNYSNGYDKSNSFKLVEQGILFDIEL